MSIESYITRTGRIHSDFTLLEMMIAVVISAVALVGLSAMQTVAIIGDPS